MTLDILSVAVVSHCQYLSNTVTGDGGSFLVEGDSDLLISDTVVINCTASRGAGIFFLTCATNSEMSNLTFFYNTAFSAGGTVFHNSRGCAVITCQACESGDNAASEYASGEGAGSLASPHPFSCTYV